MLSTKTVIASTKTPTLLLIIVGRATLKMLRRKSKSQFVKQERTTQNAIALLNNLKRIAPQQ
jgi:amino acid permease